MLSAEITISSVLSYDEGAHLSFKDIVVGRIQDSRILRMHLKASKTGPFRVGAHICSGAAITTTRRGISDAAIKMLGRWKSSAYQVYIKTRRQQLASYFCCLGNSKFASIV